MKVPIVNDQDEVIKVVDCDELDQSNDNYRVSALWVVNNSGGECDVLIAQRNFNKLHHPGLWGPSVAGTVEEGETYTENILKEAAEEIGLIDLEPIELHKEKTTEGYKHFTQWFLAFCDWPIEKFTKQDEEVEAIKWMPIDELIDDVGSHPEKYLPSFPKRILQLKDNLIKGAQL